MPSQPRRISPLTGFFRNLGICSLTGLTAGLIGGFLLTLLYLRQEMGLSLTSRQVWLIGLELTIPCWLIILLIWCGMARFSFASTGLPALLNCFITCTLTAFVVNKFQLFLFAAIIGMIIGALVGRILCFSNGIFKR